MNAVSCLVSRYSLLEFNCVFLKYTYVWSHLMAGVTALARRASEASLAEPDLLRDCLAGPRPPALSGRALDPPRRLAAWPGESSESGGDDFSDAADSLADDLAAADFWADVLD